MSEVDPQGPHAARRTAHGREHAADAARTRGCRRPTARSNRRSSSRSCARCRRPTTCGPRASTRSPPTRSGSATRSWSRRGASATSPTRRPTSTRRPRCSKRSRAATSAWTGPRSRRCCAPSSGTRRRSARATSRSRATGATAESRRLFHAPAVRVRRLADRTGWILLAADGNLDDAVQFYNWGEKVRYDRTGKPLGTLIPGRRWARNELIRFKLYASEDRDYGLPRDVAMAVEYAGDKLAKESNVSFFDARARRPRCCSSRARRRSDGMGRVTFKVPRETADRIADTLKSDSGHRHRVAIIPVPPGTTTKDVKLGEFSDRDVGFVNFRQDNARRTLSSFRLQPIFVPAVNDSGRYTAEVQRAITLEQLFDPEQTRYEEILLGGPAARDRLRPPADQVQAPGRRGRQGAPRQRRVDGRDRRGHQPRVPRRARLRPAARGGQGRRRARAGAGARTAGTTSWCPPRVCREAPRTASRSTTRAGCAQASARARSPRTIPRPATAA